MPDKEQTVSSTRSTGAKADRTRQRILQVAAHEFALNGYGGTGLRRIAAAADLKLGSLYFHFASKDDLVVEVLREGIEFAVNEVTTALDQLPADASASDRLRTAMRVHLEALHASHDRAASVVRMAATLPPALQIQQTATARKYGRIWMKIITDAQGSSCIDMDLDPPVVRDIVLGALNNTLDAGARLDADAYVDHLMRILVHRSDAPNSAGF